MVYTILALLSTRLRKTILLLILDYHQQHLMMIVLPRKRIFKVNCSFNVTYEILHCIRLFILPL